VLEEYKLTDKNVINVSLYNVNICCTAGKFGFRNVLSNYITTPCIFTWRYPWPWT